MSDVEHEKNRVQELLLRVDEKQFVGTHLEVCQLQIAAANVHATLALVGVLEEIRDGLLGTPQPECVIEGCEMAFHHHGPHEEQIRQEQGIKAG